LPRRSLDFPSTERDADLRSTSMDIELHLCALDAQMVQAWSRYFASMANVTLHEGDILAQTADAILSPANSFGFMDGGIDLAYVHHFGWELQERLQGALRNAHGGELPVGNAEIVHTGHRDIPYLISAPTMRIPGDISDTVNVYLAFRAALLAVKRTKEIRSLLSPSLGTGVGGMPFDRAAKQMHAAYSEVVLGDTGWRSTARGVLRHHLHLLS
jgi:O-acetyl-ADP-ribose deacetylase (regulator of RNase III)